MYRSDLRPREEVADAAHLEGRGEGQLVEAAIDRMAIVVAFRLQIHVLIAALPCEGEVLRHFLNQTQVEGGPLIAVAIDITILLLCASTAGAINQRSLSGVVP